MPTTIATARPGRDISTRNRRGRRIAIDQDLLIDLGLARMDLARAVVALSSAYNALIGDTSAMARE